MRNVFVLCLSAALACALTSADSLAAGAKPSRDGALKQADRDPIVGKWSVYPAVGPGGSCTITFSAISIGKTGRANPFACHRVEGLGGLHGFADVSKWQRNGSQIILSGIASPKLGSIAFPASSNPKRISGVVKGDIRFVLERK